MNATDILLAALNDEMQKIAATKCRAGRRPVRVGKLVGQNITKKAGVGRALGMLGVGAVGGGAAVHYGKKGYDRYALGRQVEQMQQQRQG